MFKRLDFRVNISKFQIPIFSTQLEKAREATDAANIRAAYAEVTTKGLTDDKTDYSLDVTATQKTAGWQGTDFSSGDSKIGGLNVDASLTGWTVSYTASTGTVTITAK